MCSAEAFALNPQDMFSGAIPLPHFPAPDFIEARFSEMDTLLQQTRSLFSHLEMRISHIEGRLQAVESYFQPDTAGEEAASGQIVSFSRAHPYRIALVGSVFASVLLVGTALHFRDFAQNRSPVNPDTLSQSAAPSSEGRTASPDQLAAALAPPIRETKAGGFPIVSNVTADEMLTPSLSSASVPANEAIHTAAAAAEAPAQPEYTVARGDTLSSIAHHYRLTLTQLLAVNHLRNPNVIVGGQKIHIPVQSAGASRVEPVETGFVHHGTWSQAQPRRARLHRNHHQLLAGARLKYKAVHVVRAGDTFYRLAVRYGIPLRTLMQTNPGLRPRRLMIAQPLVIPVAGSGTRQAVHPAAHAQQLVPARKLGAVAALTAVPGPPVPPLPTPLRQADSSAEGAVDGLTTEVSR